MPAPAQTDLPPDLSPRSRSIAVAAWSAFLSAALGTMLCFAFIDPAKIEQGEVPAWWADRLPVYAVGFFFFFVIGLAAAAMAIYLLRTEHTP
jgi:hypothetical protein